MPGGVSAGSAPAPIPGCVASLDLPAFGLMDAALQERGRKVCRPDPVGRLILGWTPEAAEQWR